MRSRIRILVRLGVGLVVGCRLSRVRGMSWVYSGLVVVVVVGGLFFCGEGFVDGFGGWSVAVGVFEDGFDG